MSFGVSSHLNFLTVTLFLLLSILCWFPISCCTKTEIIKSAQIWDCGSGAPLSSPLSLHSSWVTDLAISSGDAKYFLVLDQLLTDCLWSTLPISLSDCSTLLTAGDRLVWWSLPPAAPAPTPPSTSAPLRRKLSLPLPRARRSSGSNKLVEAIGIPSFPKRDSLHLGDEDLADCGRLPSRGSSGYGSPVESPGPRESQAGLHKRLLASLPPPTSPVGRRKVTKQGAQGKKELLQTFDVKGSLVNK